VNIGLIVFGVCSIAILVIIILVAKKQAEKLGIEKWKHKTIQ